MRNLCISLSRFCIAAWVGAAALFVVTTLKEVRAPQLDSTTKAELAVLRFPGYYQFGFALLILALVLSIAWPATVSRVRRYSVVALLIAALLVTCADYFIVFQPLLKMTAAVDQARPANFVQYHEASKWLNTVQVTLAAAAALLLSWPIRSGNASEKRSG